MIEINGKQYTINMDIKFGTQDLMRKIKEDPSNENNFKYIKYILKDLLIPAPTARELLEFRISDLERIMNEFSEESNEINKDFKKKRSR